MSNEFMGGGSPTMSLRMWFGALLFHYIEQRCMLSALWHFTTLYFVVTVWIVSVKGLRDAIVLYEYFK